MALWYSIKSKTPPTDRSVLVRHKDAAGEAFDVAMYVGRQADGEDRWVLADIRLDTRQISHWCEVPAFPGGGDQSARIAELDAQLAKANANWKAAAELVAEAMLTLAKHSKNGLRDLNRWIAEQESRGAAA
jgi:hypothetical protein